MRRLFWMAILILAVSGTSLKTRAQETSDMNDRVASLDEVLMDYDEHRSMLSRIIADRGLQDAVAGKAYIGYMTWDKWIVITQQELSEEDEATDRRYLSYSGSTGDKEVRIAAYLNPKHIESQFEMLESAPIEYTSFKTGYVLFITIMSCLMRVMMCIWSCRHIRCRQPASITGETTVFR